MLLPDGDAGAGIPLITSTFSCGKMAIGPGVSLHSSVLQGAARHGSASQSRAGPMVLSICIATYNRADFLAELLESICSQGVAGIEIIVGDDASSDYTEEVARRYKKLLPGLRYIRHLTNIGPDRNFLFVAAQASSKFVWLVGDDDRLASGALRAVISRLEQWPEVCGLTPGVIDYDSGMKRPTGVRRMPDTMQLEGSEEVFDRIVDLIGFISVTIVNREKWLEACRNNPVDEYFNGYIQVYVIACMLGSRGRWGVLDVPCIHYRTDNDQILSNVGWFKRLELDVNSYNEIFVKVFPENRSFVARMNRRILQRHVMSRVYNAKFSDAGHYDAMKVFCLLYRSYGRIGYFWAYTLPALVAPTWILRILQRLYRNYSAESGTRRAKALLGGRPTET